MSAYHQISTNAVTLRTPSCQRSPGSGVLARPPRGLSRAVVKVLSSVIWGQVKVTQSLCRFLCSVEPKPLASLAMLTGAFPLPLEASGPTRPLSRLSKPSGSFL